MFVPTAVRYLDKHTSGKRINEDGIMATPEMVNVTPISLRRSPSPPMNNFECTLDEKQRFSTFSGKRVNEDGI